MPKAAATKAGGRRVVQKGKRKTSKALSPGQAVTAGLAVQGGKSDT